MDLSKLTLSDLIGLYNNYMHTRLIPTRDLQEEHRVEAWSILSGEEFLEVKAEIRDRLAD